TDQEQVAQLIADYDLHAIPVLADGKLIGAVTADRAHDIMEEETTEDFARMSSLSSARSITNSSIGTLFRSRVTWLVILVFGNLFSGAGIAHFEDLIASAVTLVFFLPLLIDSGGNAGSQSATLMVRALAVGDVKLADWGRCLGKELGVALMLGVTMAAAVSVLGIYRGGPQVALVVALSMFLIVIVGCLIGMSLPFILAKLNMDPASASAPLITSICDGLGVIIYFTIANQLIL
ncbi:magnesium transporter, partial [Corynebacterium sp.]